MAGARVDADAEGRLVGNRLWAEWWTPTTRFYAWHLTFEDTAVPQAVSAYHQVLQDLASLELIPLPWLHLTLHGVGLVEEVPPGVRDRIAASVAGALATVPASAVEFDQWEIVHSTISLLPVSAEPFYRIRDAVRRGMAAVLGDDGLREPAGGFQPHISLAFLTADQPAAPLVDRLAEVPAGRTAVTLRKASLLEMYREDRAYRWRRIAEVPLR